MAKLDEGGVWIDRVKSRQQLDETLERAAMQVGIGTEHVQQQGLQGIISLLGEMPSPEDPDAPKVLRKQKE